MEPLHPDPVQGAGGDRKTILLAEVGGLSSSTLRLPETHLLPRPQTGNLSMAARVSRCSGLAIRIVVAPYWVKRRVRRTTQSRCHRNAPGVRDLAQTMLRLRAVAGPSIGCNTIRATCSGRHRSNCGGASFGRSYLHVHAKDTALSVTYRARAFSPNRTPMNVTADGSSAPAATDTTQCGGRSLSPL